MTLPTVCGNPENCPVSVLFAAGRFFDVESFLKEKLPPEKWAGFTNSKPMDKVTNLIELIEAAKAKNENSRFIRQGKHG